MSQLKALSPETATSPVKELFDGVQSKLGMVPNMMRTMASSPAVLNGYLQLSGALAHGALSSRIREQIALAVAEANGCEYCLAAHSTVGKMVGLSSDQIRDARLGHAVDSRVDALIRFASKIVVSRGQVTPQDIKHVRDAGYDDGAIAEVVAAVALDTFTNYFNIVADTEIDFPKVARLSGSASNV